MEKSKIILNMANHQFNNNTANTNGKMYNNVICD